MEQKNVNELGIAGMVLGIIAVTLSCVLFGGFVGIIGLCLSISAIKQTNKSKGAARAGIYLNSISIVLGIIALIVIIAIIPSSGTKNSIGNIENNIEESIPQTSVELPPVYEEENTDVIQESSSNDSGYCSVGNYILNETWKVSFLDAKEYKSIAGEHFTDSPSDGKIFLVLYFEVENVSDYDEYISTYSFNPYIDGYAADQVFIFNEPDGYPSLNFTVAPGMKAKGTFILEVYPDWKEVALNYDQIFKNDQLKFSVKKDEVN